MEEIVNKSTSKTFEDIKHIDEYVNEYCFARDLQKVLEYKGWKNFNKVIELLTKVEKAEAAAARARTAVMESQKSVEKELKKKSVLAGKLVDCEKHNEESQLLIVEGKSALGSIVNARDGRTTACFPLRGKMINTLKNTEEDIFNNQEVKELQIALGCGIGDKFNMKKLRYGRICIAADMDMDRI